jgi:hypothetical protein
MNSRSALDVVGVTPQMVGIASYNCRDVKSALQFSAKAI